MKLKLLRKILFVIGLSYYVHLIIVRLPYISVHLTGYMAEVTPACFWWGVISFLALMGFFVIDWRSEWNEA